MDMISNRFFGSVIASTVSRDVIGEKPHGLSLRWLAAVAVFIILAVLWHLVVPFTGSSAAANSQTIASVGSSAADGKASACALTLKQFVSELDSVLTENPNSIFRYQAILAKYLSLKSGAPGLPMPMPGASVAGCKIGEVVEIAKHSKFFHTSSGPPRYSNYKIEFRNSVAKVGFGIEKTTGNVIGPYATWIAVYP